MERLYSHSGTTPGTGEPSLLTVSEGASFLRLKPSTIRAWILGRRINHVKLGGRVLLRRCDLENLIVESLVPAKPGDAEESRQHENNT
jgi:excisionase family DNA binding protein